MRLLLVPRMNVMFDIICMRPVEWNKRKLRIALLNARPSTDTGPFYAPPPDYRAVDSTDNLRMILTNNEHKRQ